MGTKTILEKLPQLSPSLKTSHLELENRALNLRFQ